MGSISLLGKSIERMKKIIKKIIQRFYSFKKHPLTKTSPQKALLRYFIFNILHRIHNVPRIYKWINGLKFYAEKGDAGIVPNIYFKLFDYEDSMFVLDEIKENDVFVDIGANVGHFTMLAARNGAIVYSFEPVPQTFLKLEKNLKLNNLSKSINTFNYGIGEKTDILYFSCNRGVMNQVVSSDYLHSIAVNVFPLDKVLSDVNPKMIKIDVEGYEYFVLKGGADTLKKKSLHYVLIELNDSSLQFGFTSDQIHQILLDNNFVPVRYSPNVKSLVGLESFNKDSFNTLYKRKDD